MAMNFRKSFHVASRELIRWFPGHMGKGLKQMQQRLKQVDCIIGELCGGFDFVKLQLSFNHF